MPSGLLISLLFLGDGAGPAPSSAQFGRPIADIINADHWLDNAGSSVTIFDAIDESVLSTSDYIQSSAGLSSAIYVAALTTTLEDPATSTGHIIRYVYRKDSSGAAQINLTVELRQDYVSEASLGTLIWTTNHINIVSSVQSTAAVTLLAAEADTITAYSSLYLRFISNQI